MRISWTCMYIWQCVCMFIRSCLLICMLIPAAKLRRVTDAHQAPSQSSCSITRLGANLVLAMCCRYQEAIRLHPGCPAEVRLGLAACYFRLGQLERAKKAYERVVQLSPTCAEALYGLAVLRFSSSQGESAKAVSDQPCFQQAALYIQHVAGPDIAWGQRMGAHTWELTTADTCWVLCPWAIPFSWLSYTLDADFSCIIVLA